jgi:hypothetical protein
LESLVATATRLLQIGFLIAMIMTSPTDKQRPRPPAGSKDVTSHARAVTLIGAEAFRPVASSDIQRAAYHEAGHCTAALAFAIPIIRVTIDAATPHLQRGRYQPPHDAGLESLCVLCLAGPEAERMAFGSIEPGTDDLAMARRYLAQRLQPGQIAAEMIRLRGSAERLVRSEWARRRIALIADALLARGTLSGADIAAIPGPAPKARWSL